MHTGSTSVHADFTKQTNSITPVLHRYALYLTKDAEDANDLLQDTLLRGYRYWSHYEPGTNLKAWLVVIMRNIFLTQRLRLQRQRCVLVFKPLDQLPDRVPGSSGDGELNGDLENIWAAINQLVTVHREPFLLHVQGQKYHEIAQQLAIPIGTVKNRIHRARKALQQKLA